MWQSRPRKEAMRPDSSSTAQTTALQGKFIHTRYRAPETPRRVRNIPKFYTAGKLQSRKVLMFDIRDPEPYCKLWHVGNLNAERATQDCIFDDKDNTAYIRNGTPSRKRALDTTEEPPGRTPWKSKIWPSCRETTHTYANKEKSPMLLNRITPN